MKSRWEILTGWKVDLETEEDRFEYFNTESFIPGQIYRIHVSNGVPVIVEFQQFGYRYNYNMTKLFPCILTCNNTPDIQIKEITDIFVHNIDEDDDDKDVSSESVKTTTDVSGFKDFVVNKHSYHVNEKLKDIETVSGVCSDKININGELKITGIDIVIDRYPCSTSRSIRLELPTGDEITIPASYHPWIKSDQDSLPVFTKEPELKWHEDLVAGEYYIVSTKVGMKQLVLIRSISIDKIEYDVCTSRYDKNNGAYVVETIAHELTIDYAVGYKFIPLKDITC